MNYIEAELFNDYGRRMLGSSSNGAPVHITTTIEPRIMFFDLLSESKDFTNLLGWRNVGGGKRSPRNQSSWFWKYKDRKTGGGCILCLPDDHFHHARVHLQSIWSDPQYGQSGCGTRAMLKLLAIVDEVNNHCREKKKYKNKHMSCNIFSMFLVPNPFTPPEGWTLGPEEINWTDPVECTEGTADETVSDLDKSYQRAGWKKLRNWYQRLGFHEMVSLNYEYVWNPNERRVMTLATLTDRSIKMGRQIMAYPEENARIIDDCRRAEGDELNK